MKLDNYKIYVHKLHYIHRWLGIFIEDFLNYKIVTVFLATISE